MKLNDELLEKAKKAETPEELMALAKENGMDLSDEEAKTCFAKLNAGEGELGDDELGDVAGGRKCGTTYYDDMPVVTAYNSCENYAHEVYMDGTGSGYCKNCMFYAQRGFLFVCRCRVRRNN